MENGLRLLLCGLGIILGISSVNCEQTSPVREAIVGDALLNEEAYQFLQEMCDRFGPRMVGTDGHRKSMDFLERRLSDLGFRTERQIFQFPGWARGESKVEIVEPFKRSLRAAAIGYTRVSTQVEGELFYVESSRIEDLVKQELKGKVLLLRPNLRFSHKDLTKLASDHGILGIAMINRVNGGQLLARVANHNGEPTPIPMMTITQEEGFWMKRLLLDGATVRIRIETTSESRIFDGINLITSLPGSSGEKIVLGAHFDSWDLGQGAMDNGLGVAQIYEVARLLKNYSHQNLHTIEFVWFDAEELGLWGSRHYANTSSLDGIRAMVNLDMVGNPIAINAMGFDELVPFLENFSNDLGSWSFDRKVESKAWLGGDHHPFILKGVPSITLNAPINSDDVRYYHDFADTLDKVDRSHLARSSAIVGLLVQALANDQTDRASRLSTGETAELFRKSGLEDRMRKAGQWPFADD